MTKLLNSFSLLVAAGALSTLAGCELYFGNDHNSDSWNYCGSDGYYQCSGDNCEWTSPSCPDGSSSGSGSTEPGSNGGSGFECSSNTDCAAGCYCTSGGVCEEGGFCATDADCGNGYHCDTNRSSCEPNTVPTCSTDADCTGTNQTCDTTSHTCAQADCAVSTTVTCNIAAPVCPSGSVPLEYNGCYTGGCGTVASCTTAPSCSYINDQDDCVARAQDCSPTYTGLNCTHSDGSACQSGADPDCNCQMFEFASCVAR
ncbi:MAG: hypothetical protein QM831_04890 [Kofleriaceae bacterium]